MDVDANLEEGNEVIRLFIVDEDGKEVELDGNNSSFIKLEITNTEDEQFGLEDTECLDTCTENSDEAFLLDNIKVEVIDDPETEFGEFYEQLDYNEDEDIVLQGDNRYKLKRKESALNGLESRPKKLYVCNLCGYTSHQKSHYRRHLSIHFKPEGLRCSICREPMSSKAELNDHMDEHRCEYDSNRFKCNLCPYTSNKLTNVSQHTEVHYKPKKERMECERCNFATTNKVRFRNHAAIHLNSKRSTKCPVCLVVFKTMSLRRRHIQRYKSPDDPNRFQCPECSYNTLKFNNFKQHMVVHRNEYEIEMFQCHYCPFKSKRKTDLRQHVIVKHKTDDEVTLFQCDFCSYESRRGNHLTSHMKNRHRRELSIKKCGLCSYKTVSQVLIEKHITIHSKIPDRLFLCSICGIRCQSQHLLDMHASSVHKDDCMDSDDDGSVKLRVGKKQPTPQNDIGAGYSFEFMKIKEEEVDTNFGEDETGDEHEKAVYCCQFPQCNFVSIIERDAKIHMTICHNKRGDDNRCPECTFHTTSRYLYLDHLKVHKIDIEHLKPHLCDICGTRWIRQGDLTRHMSVHWGGESERRKRTVVKTEDTSNKKLMKCALCTYSTRIRLCLYKHLLKHGIEHQKNFANYIMDRENSE